MGRWSAVAREDVRCLGIPPFREVGVDAHEEGHRTLAATEYDGWKERPPPASILGKRSTCKRQAVRGERQIVAHVYRNKGARKGVLPIIHPPPH